MKRKLADNIILIGMKSSGKTSVGRLLADRLAHKFLDLDVEIENVHCQQTQKQLHFREIFKQYGQDYFRRLETSVLETLSNSDPNSGFILATGGGTPLAETNQKILKTLGMILYLDVDQKILLARITAGGIPPFFPYPTDPEKSLSELLAVRRPIYQDVAHLTCTYSNETPLQIVDKVITLMKTYAN